MDISRRDELIKQLMLDHCLLGHPIWAIAVISSRKRDHADDFEELRLILASLTKTIAELEPII
jgi:hypothetical protein